MGDKTQVATVMLAAKFDSLVAVVVGTTLGMLVVNVPTVFIGQAAAEKIPFRAVRIAAAALFAGPGRVGAARAASPRLSGPAPV